MEKIGALIKRKRIPRAKSAIEQAAWRMQGLICGVDEVGRGCLAGPLVTAAVILYPRATFPLLKDSKLLTKEQRVRATRWIKEHSWYAYGMLSHHEIDRLNIYQATLWAMRRAVLQLCAGMLQAPARIIVDAMPLSFEHTVLAQTPVEYFPFAEQRSISVAAASILAKVQRDNLMSDFDKIIPGYALGVHKGYATTQHRQCVAQLGQSIIHRKTFIHDINGEEGDFEQQITLFCGSGREFPDAL